MHIVDYVYAIVIEGNFEYATRLNNYPWLAAAIKTNKSLSPNAFLLRHLSRKNRFEIILWSNSIVSKNPLQPTLHFISYSSCSTYCQFTITTFDQSRTKDAFYFFLYTFTDHYHIFYTATEWLTTEALLAAPKYKPTKRSGRWVY